jgi:hypothetical protein
MNPGAWIGNFAGAPRDKGGREVLVYSPLLKTNCSKGT